jgi:hypothetical protein
MESVINEENPTIIKKCTRIDFRAGRKKCDHKGSAL